MLNEKEVSAQISSVVGAFVGLIAYMLYALGVFFAITLLLFSPMIFLSGYFIFGSVLLHSEGLPASGSVNFFWTMSSIISLMASFGLGISLPDWQTTKTKIKIATLAVLLYSWSILILPLAVG